MTWKRMLGVTAFALVAVWLAAFFILSRQDIPDGDKTVMGVRSLFPAGDVAPVRDAKNGWRGFDFGGRFRFFSRPSRDARTDFRELVRSNFERLPLRTGLSLFAGGLCALERAGKGYRLFCIFFKEDTVYWADMLSRDSLDFCLRAFERFMLNLEIGGEKASPLVAGQLAALRARISPFVIQSPAMVLTMMAGIFLLSLLLPLAVNSYGGSRPRRFDWPVEMCAPGATLTARRFGRRRLMACCLCLEGDFLVVYRFRRPYVKIDLPGEKQDIVWDKKGFRHKNIRVILKEEESREWRFRLMG
jgi:hypothetical protein